MSHIFISYSHKDKDYVHKLQRALQEEGFDAWIDDRIDYGEEWLKIIQNKLDGCDAFVIVMSQNSFESDMVQNECTRALNKRKRIFPVLLEGEHWFVFQAKQFVDVRDGSLPQQKFYTRLEQVASRDFHKQDKLKALENQAAADEAAGNVWAALQAWDEIKQLDPQSKKADIKRRDLARIAAKRERQKRWERMKTQSMQSISGALRSVQSFFKSLVPKGPREWKKYRTPIILGSSSLLGISVIAALLLRPEPLYYNYYENGKTEIYRYLPGQEPQQITKTPGSFDSWGPVLSANALFFSSNRDGKAEIYRFTDAKGTERITNTPGNFASWGPVPGYNVLYFTSDRTGKAEVYKLTEDKGTEQVTYTAGTSGSWGPALGINILYFTSNRDGRPEIYRLTEDNGIERITYTPNNQASWGVVVSSGTLFFVSDRDGKAEIYKFTDANGTERVTYTPGNFKSWGPLVRGKTLIFTSDRSGRAQLYELSADPEPILDAPAWTSFLVDQYPSPPNR